DEARQGWRCHGGCRRGLSERHSWRSHRPCGHSHDHLVRPSWLAQGRAAGDLPAHRGRDIRHERAVAWGPARRVAPHHFGLWFFVLGLPALLAGTWLGLKLYGHLDEAGFRKLVLVLLLVSGMALVAPALAPLFG